MKMTLREVRKNFEAMQTLQGMVFPAKLGFAIAYNTDRLQKEAERIEKQRLELCRQFAKKGEDGEPAMLKSVINGQQVESFDLGENQKDFEREYADLLDDEIEIEIRKVKSEEIEKCDTAERYSIPNVAQILGMGFMIDED